MSNRRLWVQCVCGAGGLNIEQDGEDIYVAMWHYGQQPLSIMHKLHWIRSILEGRPFRDQIVIDQERLQEIIDGLEEMKE